MQVTIGQRIVQHIDRIMRNISNKAGYLIVITFWLIVMLLLSSCGMVNKMTEKELELQYQIDKAYFEYSHKRDSLIVEHYRK